MKTKTIIVEKVDYNEVERVIEEHYGFDEYCLPDAEEVGNDVSLEWNIDGEVDKWDVEDIKQRKARYCTQAYMNDLARQGIISKAVYLIDVSW